MLTFAIYIRAGVEIFKQRNTLRDLHENIAVDLPVHSSYQNQTSRLIQTLARPAPSIDIEHAWALGPAHHHDFDPSGIDKDIVLYSKRGFDPEHPTGRPGAYSIPVEQDLAIPRQETDRPHTSPVTEPLEPLAKRDTIISVTARAYFKYALLYFVALIVTWVSIISYVQGLSLAFRLTRTIANRSHPPSTVPTGLYTPTTQASASHSPPRWCCPCRASGTALSTPLSRGRWSDNYSHGSGAGDGGSSDDGRTVRTAPRTVGGIYCRQRG